MHDLSGNLCYDYFFRKTHARLYSQISMRVCRLQRPTKWVRHVQLGRVRRDPIFQQWQEQRDWSEHRLLRHPWRACVDRHQDGPRDVILRYAAAEIHLLQGPSDRGHQEHPHIRPQSIHSYPGRWIGKNSDTFNNKSYPIFDWQYWLSDCKYFEHMMQQLQYLFLFCCCEEKLNRTKIKASFM